MARLPSVTSAAAVAERLELTREALGLTQAGFSRRTGIGVKAYNNYKMGRRRPSPEQAEAIYRGTGIDPNWLWRGDPSTLRADLLAGIQKLIAKKKKEAQSKAVERDWLDVQTPNR
jgi:transcriptional regulator with XRE-family HTH domain